MASDIAIGIDLGTTNCCVAVQYKGEVIIIPNQAFDGSTTTPSYVEFVKDGSVKVGQSAKEKCYRNLETTIYDAKRIIGREFADPVLQNDMKYWPFKVKEVECVPKIEIRGRDYHPEEVSARLLQEMKSIAEKYLKLDNGAIKKAVITVPAYFNDGQRQATVDAGKLAGLEVLSILNEPTAAAIAFFNKRLEKEAKKVLIFDLGGGTLDVAVVEILSDSVNVLGIHGDTHLGGEDFDKNMMIYCARKFKEQTGIDLLGENKSPKEKVESLKAIRRLQMACEKSKRCLSGNSRFVEVDVDGIMNGEDVSVEISSETFEKINSELFQNCIKVIDEALVGSKIQKSQIDDIILVGGSTRLKKVRYLLESYFEKKKLNTSINPDEAVAYGAAVQAAILAGKKDMKSKPTLVQDVTGISVGMKNSDGKLSVFIPKNTKIPVQVSRRNFAVADNQTTAGIHVFQGEDIIAENNKLLGKFILDDLPKTKEGGHICDTIMEINQNGILHVTAVSPDKAKKSELTVIAEKHRMSEATIEKLLTEMKM